jgi:hypothetical protein
LFELSVEGVLVGFPGVLFGFVFELPPLLAAGAGAAVFALSVDAVLGAGAGAEAGAGTDAGADAGLEACAGSDDTGAGAGTGSEDAAVFDAAFDAAVFDAAFDAAVFDAAFDAAAGEAAAAVESVACVPAGMVAGVDVDGSVWVVGGSLGEFAMANSEAVCVGGSVWLLDCVGIAAASVLISVEGVVSVEGVASVAALLTLVVGSTVLVMATACAVNADVVAELVVSVVLSELVLIGSSVVVGLVVGLVADGDTTSELEVEGSSETVVGGSLDVGGRTTEGGVVEEVVNMELFDVVVVILKLLTEPSLSIKRTYSC